MEGSYASVHPSLTTTTPFCRRSSDCPSLAGARLSLMLKGQFVRVDAGFTAGSKQPLVVERGAWHAADVNAPPAELPS